MADTNVIAVTFPEESKGTRRSASCARPPTRAAWTS